MTTIKRKKLEEFLKKYKDLPEQGTQKWKKLRETCIGGSEISIITGDNKYSSIKDLIKRKIGLSIFNGNLATRWGKIFEIITTILCERILDISEISEASSLPTNNSYLRYSPDGLTVGTMNINGKIKNQIILFEFKSPLSTIPLGVVPKQYLPQVKMGLWAIKYVDISLFINNMYRKCSLEDLTDNGLYDKEFHMYDKKKMMGELNPLAMGMILFYQTEKQKKKYIKHSKIKIMDMLIDNNKMNDEDMLYEENIENILYKNMNNKIQELLDLGKLKKDEINKLFKMYDDEYLSIYVTDPYILKNMHKLQIFEKEIFVKPYLLKETIKKYKKRNLKKFKKISNTKTCLGVLCWKLFKSDIILIKRDDNYIDKYINKINDVMDDIKNIRTKIENNINPIEAYEEITIKYQKKKKIKKKKFNKKKLEDMI